MFTEEVQVKSTIGLHARFATSFVQKANEYEAAIWIEKEDRRVNAKSLLGVLSLDIGQGSVVKVIAEEEEAVKQLIALIGQGFFEGKGENPELLNDKSS